VVNFMTPLFSKNLFAGPNVRFGSIVLKKSLLSWHGWPLTQLKSNSGSVFARLLDCLIVWSCCF
jgi:hypothetical protein